MKWNSVKTFLRSVATVEMSGIWWCSVTIISVLAFLLSLHSEIGDFGNYYFGSSVFLDGNFSILNYQGLSHFNQQIRSYYQGIYFENYAPVPPFSVLFYLPLTLLPLFWSKFLFNLFGWLLCGISVHYFIKVNNLHVQKEHLFIPLVLFYPIYHTFAQGQSYFIILAIILFSFCFERQGRWIVSSALLSIAISLKIFPAFFLLYFLIGKKWKSLFAVGVSMTLLHLPLVPMLGLDTLLHYVGEILPRLASNDVVGAFYYSNQSFQTLLLQLFYPESMHNPNPLFSMPWLVPLGEAILVSFVFARLWLERKKGEVSFFSFLSLGMILCSRYNPIYAQLLLFPFLWMIPLLFESGKVRWILWVTIALAFWSAVFMHGRLPFFLRFFRIEALIFVFLFSAYHRSLPSIRLLSFVFVFMAFIRVLGFTYESPVYASHQASKGVLYHYEVQQDSLVVYGTMGNVDTRESFPISKKVFEDSALTIKGSTLCYGDQVLAKGKYTILKPLRWGEDSVIVMSDLHQGLYMYKLMLIPLAASKRRNFSDD
ncbi:MAG: DUF2029 domain-containing protein [Cytophagaceae bacterium]|jgi:hypothetical protein|nr:DUF2029 domain-containing protein [Cytophagaceae bacterium]